ncbi:response regulator [Youhaiella tibetensis]|uniref:Response regulator n=1 Tax=Paradevosia tibetensis TaxID=1447062 RepID=A0A5B9DSG3_9HYPH|nr:response regulator [Youhaiella tibetensis]QEE21992.1 response regulator [Youhaiella tibetensis]GGF46349.1 response regulator [Youhaiella tibetensis]
MASPDLADLSVLVAESNMQMADLVSQMLRGLGVRKIQVATDAVAASSILRRGGIDVLMIDDALSGLNGTTFTRRLRRSDDENSRHVAVLMMSSQPSAASITLARDAGITEFLRRPFSAAQIGEKLGAIVSAPRPFIDTAGYAGPDRRRRKAGVGGDERRSL